MVGQEILVLFIMVRIRAPQPQLLKCPLGHFLFSDISQIALQNIGNRLKNLLILYYVHCSISPTGEDKHTYKKTGKYDVKNPVKF